MNGFIERGAFVSNLVEQWLESNIEVDVVAPVAYPLYIKTFKNRKANFKKPPGSCLMQPKFFSLSGYFKNYERKSFLNVVLKSASRLNKPDLYYGKFLFGGARAAVVLGQKRNIPVIADLGESKLLNGLSNQDEILAKDIVRKLAGAVVVSQRLKNEIIELGLEENKILLISNAINKNIFKPINKNKCREQLGLPKDKFIISFVGHFENRKGPLRVLKSIEKLNNQNIKAIFLGKGKEQPTGDSVLKASSVSNKDLPIWLNASDLFILPTLAEGNCNAINEAMGCGLPIISSDIEDVKFQVNNKNSILINPNSTDELSLAINSLYSNKKKLKSMSVASLEIAELLDLNNRSKIILNWMKKIV